MDLIALHGIPGVGKKTVGTALAEKTGFLLLDNHKVLDLVRSYIPQRFPVSVEIGREIRRMLFEGIVEANQYPGVITTFAGGSAGAAEKIKTFLPPFLQSGGNVHFVELTADIDIVRERIEREDRKGTFKVQYQHELDGFLQKNYFKGLPEYPSVRIDNSAHTPESCAEEIIRALNLPMK